MGEGTMVRRGVDAINETREVSIGARAGYRRVTIHMSDLDWATIELLKIVTGASSKREVRVADVRALSQAAVRREQLRKAAEAKPVPPQSQAHSPPYPIHPRYPIRNCAAPRFGKLA
jgi:hypothetical protein